MSQQPVDPYGTRLPIKLDTTSNGEFVPVPLSRANLAANRLAHEAATRNAKRLGLSRRGVSRVRVRRGEHAPRVQRRQRGGRQARRLLRARARGRARAAARRGEARRQASSSSTCRGTSWTRTAPGCASAPPDAFKWSPKAACAFAKEPGPRSHLALPRARGVREGRVPRQRHRPDGAVLRALAARRRAARRSRRRTRCAGSSTACRARTGCCVHGRVNPNQPGDVEAMDELAGSAGRCSAWKTYTQFGPGGKGFFLSDDVGIALHREGARARRQGHLRAQGTAVRQAVLRAQPVQRHRRGREALSGRELPHLSLGLRERRPRAGLRRAARTATGSTR